MESWVIDADTPRSTGFGTPRDDRFHTPRAHASSNVSSGDEWQTPRGIHASDIKYGGVSSDGEYVTPRAAFPQDSNAYRMSSSMNTDYDPHIARMRSRPQSGRAETKQQVSSQFVNSDRQSNSTQSQINNNSFYNSSSPKHSNGRSNGIIVENNSSKDLGYIENYDVEDIFSYARHGRCDDIEKLLDRCVPVDVRDEFGNTLLITACQNGNKRVAKCVLRRGANINARNHKGNTPLHYCFHYGYGDSLGEYLMSKVVFLLCSVFMTY